MKHAYVYNSILKQKKNFPLNGHAKKISIEILFNY